MLTGDLVRVRVKGKEISPSFIALTSPKNRQRASSLLSLFQAAHQRQYTRFEVENVIRDMASIEVDHKIVKGFGKILLDRCEFIEPQFPQDISPQSLRHALFMIAARKGPLAASKDFTQRQSRTAVLQELADQYESSVEEIEKYLYADRREMHHLSTFKDFNSTDDLLHRYNVALCQSLFLRATQIRIHLQDASPKWLRFLFKNIKFHRLIFQVKKKSQTVSLQLDGPQSLFEQSTRYGMQMALFFPALLLLPTPWQLEADIMWGKKRKYKKILKLHSNMLLQSHYKATGTWRSNAEKWFEERFLAKETKWKLTEGEVLSLTGQRVLVPDFCFQQGKTKIYMEIVGFWRKQYLEKLIADCPNNVIIAVSRKLAGGKNKISAQLEKQVIPFSEVISVKKVIDKLNEMKNNEP